MECAVFIFAGFLEAGKTTALKGTLGKAFDTKNNSVVICTEEGEEDYDTAELAANGIALERVEDEESFSIEYLVEIEEKYEPECVYIEFNGMWDLGKFLKKGLPAGWYIAEVFSFVDAGMYELYLKNMRITLMNPLKEAGVIMFNRCEEAFDKAGTRRAMKILNSKAEVFFVRPDGSVDYGLDELVLDAKNNVLEISDDLFCPWFVDCIENADKYFGKTVRFVGMVSGGYGLEENQFYLGRYAVICCQEDAQFIGFVAKCNQERFKGMDWIEAEAVITKGNVDGDRLIIVLKIENFKRIDEPEDAFVYY